MSERWSVLIVDRDSELRSEVRRLLFDGAARQYDFIESGSGQDALDVLALLTPTCLVVGDVLPDMDAAQLLSQPDGKHQCAALVLTESVEWSLPRLSSGGAAVECLPRRWMNPTSLTRALENAVERQALRRDRDHAVAQLREREAHAQKTEAQLHGAARQKDEFIAMLAHELRNPLAPIRTAVAVLRSRGTGDPVVNQCGKVIDRQSTQMARLLEDLLDVSRLSRGRLVLQREPIVLQDVIDAAAETARPHIQQHQHELVIDYPKLPIFLQGDAVRLAQVLGNLLNNAAKFTPTKGRIAVTVTQEERDVVVTVRDNGIGIAPEEQQGIFVLFSQLVDPRRTHSGLGIGLSLARQLVEMHDGSITVSSDGPGAGSAFTVRLPLMQMMEHASQIPEADASAKRLNHRVVVADDNADAAEMLAAWLRILGCDVRTVHDGLAAFQIERLVPDAAFIDLTMPGMGGYELCRRIRQTPWGAGVTLVALTGRGQDNDRSQSAAAGFDHHVLKPADLEMIAELLREVTPKPE